MYVPESFSKPTQTRRSRPCGNSHYDEKDWEEITEDGFRKILATSPLKRAKYQGIRRNLQFSKRVDG